jgi:hypothetical protein
MVRGKGKPERLLMKALKLKGLQHSKTKERKFENNKVSL